MLACVDRVGVWCVVCFHDSSFGSWIACGPSAISLGVRFVTLLLVLSRLCFASFVFIAFRLLPCHAMYRFGFALLLLVLSSLVALACAPALAVNDMGAEGGKAIGDALKANTTLQQLGLAGASLVS